VGNRQWGRRPRLPFCGRIRPQEPAGNLDLIIDRTRQELVPRDPKQIVSEVE
jgi:hypothetical protein